MNSASTQFVPSRRMGIYEPIHQMSMWGDFNANNCLDTSPPLILEFDTKLDDQSEDTSHGTVGLSSKYDQEASKPDKVLRRLAQNREAARKSRLRKKAYVQQLESSKLRLLQLEQELDRTRQPGLYAGGGLDTSQLGHPGTRNPGIATFELEYGHWIETQNRQIHELTNALRSSIGDMELQSLVDSGMKLYLDLFSMKARVAKVDIFYLISGMWKTPAERFFFWVGGFRPSELLKVFQSILTKTQYSKDKIKQMFIKQIISPHLEPMSEQQCVDVYNLKQSCQQMEDALSQGMEKLHHTLVDTIASGDPQIGAAIDKLDELVRVVGQADHLRQETLQQILRVLTTRQAARGLLALGDYLKRLRTLSSVWASRSREPA